MKKLTYIVALAIAVYAMQGCQGSSNVKQSTDSMGKTSDTVVSASNPVDSSDSKFAKEAAGGGMAEIQLSKLAGQKAAGLKIKNFAAMMVTDHTKAGDSLMVIAKNQNITLPAKLDSLHQAKYDSLSKMSGTGFDEAYVKIMLADHKGALKLMQGEAKNSTDAALKAFAAKTAAVVQMHLDAIEKIDAGMK